MHRVSQHPHIWGSATLPSRCQGPGVSVQLREELVPLVWVGLALCGAGLRQSTEQFVACCLAAPASLRAQAAVLVHFGVFLAFLCTGSARLSAGLQHSADHIFVFTREAGEDPAGRQADVGTVLVCAYTAHQFAGHRFAETSISARRTGLRTFEAGCNTRRERLLLDSEIFLGMSLKHGLHVRHDLPLFVSGVACHTPRLPPRPGMI